MKTMICYTENGQEEREVDYVEFGQEIPVLKENEILAVCINGDVHIIRVAN